MSSYPTLGGLCDTDSLGKLPCGQRAGAVDRRKKGILGGLNGDAELFDDALHISLKAFADTAEAAAEAEEPQRFDDIFNQDVSSRQIV